MVSFRHSPYGVVSLTFFLVLSAEADDRIIPEPTRIINVSSSAQLSSALSKAEPGDHIALANGTYSGFTVSRSGEDGKPVLISAQNTLGAKVSGRITLGGNDVYVVGLDVINGNVVIKGTRDRISRSRLRSRGSAIHLENSARSAIVDHNEIESQATPLTTAWNGIRVDVTSPGLNHHIYRNYLHGAPKPTTGDGNSGMQIGFGGSRGVNGGVLIEYNLFTDWYGDAETISVKTSGHIIRFNTAINTTEFVNRNGTHNEWYANWFEDAQGIRIHDRDQTVLGNRANIRVMAGDCEPPAAGASMEVKACHAPAWDTVVAGNVGRLRVGYAFKRNSFPAKNTKVDGHRGSVSMIFETATSISARTDRAIPPAAKLNPSDVGPFAPTAPIISG
jgi:Chondroitinase B